MYPTTQCPRTAHLVILVVVARISMHIQITVVPSKNLWEQKLRCLELFSSDEVLYWACELTYENTHRLRTTPHLTIFC